MKSIGKEAFGGCNALCQVNWPDELEEIGDKAFTVCGLTVLKLPEGVKTIGDEAFRLLYQVEEVYFPYSLEKLGIYSCAEWAKVKAIYCEAPIPPKCEFKTSAVVDSPFGNWQATYKSAPQDTPVYVPVGTAKAYKKKWGWNRFNNYIEKEYSEVESVEAAGQEGPARYFNMQGMEIPAPQPGQVCIKLQGSRARKILGR